MNTNNNIIEKIKNDIILNIIKDHAKDSDAYVVGGVIRDLFLNKDNFDKDIIIDKTDAKEFAQSLSLKLDARFIPLDEDNNIYRIILKDKITCIDIANVIGNSIEDDLKRRDLSINSIAINLKTLEILDYSDGLKDLTEEKIRHISEENFIDDPLRMLRVFRFQANLGFEIDQQTINIIRKHASLIHNSSIERINHELLKLFSGNFCEDTLIKMDEADFLEELFPIMKDVKKVPPNLHHHLNLFMHSIETVKQIQLVYKNGNEEVKKHLNKLDFGGATRLAHLKFAGFLHDIGKFETWTIEEETGRHRFMKHDDVGSKLGLTLLKRFKYSKKQIEYITKMIKYHIYPSHVIQSPELNEKIYMRFVRKMQEDVIDVITLAKADRLSARGVEITQEIVNKNINGLDSLQDFYINIKENLKPLPKLLSGEEIMEILSIQPSKQLGDIVKRLQDAQLNGDINTKEEAINYISALKTL